MKVLMLEGRPAEHPIHRSYAKSVGADFLYIDQFLRYQGKTENKVFIIFSWLLTCIYLLWKSRYNVYLCGGPCPPLILLKRVGLLGKDKLVVSLAANETLFFLKEDKYSGFTTQLYRTWYNSTIDGIICIGSFQEQLAKEYINNKEVKILKIFNGLHDDFFKIAEQFEYNVNGKDIICIANGPSGFRVYYKGLDILIKVFSELHAKGHDGNLIIVGQWDEKTQNHLLCALNKKVASKIQFTGLLRSYLPYLKSVGLSLHFSRGDSFPTSNLETLAFGIPTIVTNTTGTAEIIRLINNDWVVPSDIKLLQAKVSTFFKLTNDEKLFFSTTAKKMMYDYKHSNAVFHFHKAFNEIIDSQNE